jgi:hypothetical protein
MFEQGKQVYFRDDQFKAHFGTIVEKVCEDTMFVTLRVKSKYDGKIYTVKKTNWKNPEEGERQYREYGHY